MERRRARRVWREDACRQRFEQNRASARRPAGIGPPHQVQLSGGGDGRLGTLVLEPGARGGLTAALRAVARLGAKPWGEWLAAALAHVQGLAGATGGQR